MPQRTNLCRLKRERPESRSLYYRCEMYRTGQAQWCWMIDQPSDPNCQQRKSRLLEVTLQQALQSLAVTGLVAGHFMDGLQNAAFQAAYLQGRGWLFCTDILSFQRKLRNIFLSEMCELSLNFGTSPVHLLTSF